MIATQRVNDLLSAQAQHIAAMLGIAFPEASREAQTLLRRTLGVARSWLVAHADDSVAYDDAEKFEEACARRARGEPVAYITGVREFYGLEFAVAPGVLIPRPETELLVEISLAKLPAHAPCRVLDLGTGSGAIAVTLAHLRPQARVVAVDIAPDALTIASANALLHGVNNIGFMESDWFANLPAGQFDLIVSNPPYVATGDAHLQNLRFEPLVALAAGNDGMRCLREVITGAPAFLAIGGQLLVEHGFNQARRCTELAIEAEFSKVESHLDVAGIARVMSGMRAR